MKLKDAIRGSEWLIVPAVLIVAAWFSGSYYGQRKVESSIQTATDTVVKVVTAYKDFPKPQETAKIGFIPIPAYKFLADTITREIAVYVHDTTVVYLPREQKYYSEDDGRMRLWISGYEPRLDRYEIDYPTTVITNTITERRSRWSLGVSVGYGVTITDGKIRPGPTVSAGVTYSLIAFQKRQ